MYNMNTNEALLVSEYEKTLVIAENKPRSQFMLCPVGLVGSGKTTVIKPLSKKLNLLRISSDELRKLFKENGVGYEHIYNILAQLIERYLKQGYSIGIDGDCASLHTRGLISKAEKELNIKIVWVHINPPENFIINKLKNFKHTWLFNDANQALENYQNRKPLHDNLDMPFLYTFDTSREDLPSQIEEAAQIINTATQA